MTLVVSAFWDDPVTGELAEFTDWADGHSMAGVEGARWAIWGSEAVRRRGARLVPRLANADLRVEHEELDAFVAEVKDLLHDVDALRAELGHAPDSSLEHYLNNFLRAAEYACSRRGGVSIT